MSWPEKPPSAPWQSSKRSISIAQCYALRNPLRTKSPSLLLSLPMMAATPFLFRGLYLGREQRNRESSPVCQVKSFLPFTKKSHFLLKDMCLGSPIRCEFIFVTEMCLIRPTLKGWKTQIDNCSSSTFNQVQHTELFYGLVYGYPYRTKS